MGSIVGLKFNGNGKLDGMREKNKWKEQKPTYSRTQYHSFPPGLMLYVTDSFFLMWKIYNIKFAIYLSV